MEQITPWVDKLNSMASADEVALFFAEEGVKGRPQQASSCAVSSFLSAKTGKHVTTIPGQVNTWDDDVRTREHVALAAPVNDFIAKFDERGYPNLLR